MRRPRILLATRLARVGSLETPFDVIAAATRLAAEGLLHLPYPGNGDTWTRFEVLAEIAATDLSLAQIALGHVDAHAMLGQAGCAARRGMYGVWTAPQVTAVRTNAGWKLVGRKRYASGATGLDRALVTAVAHDGVRLFDVPLRDGGVMAVPDSWRSPGMSLSDSLDVAFDLEVGADAAVGPPDFYATGPGLWRGVGHAACWFGGALGAARMLTSMLARFAPDEHQAAHIASIGSAIEAMRAVLERSAHEIDDGLGDGHARARAARNVVESGCEEVLVRIGHAGGDREHDHRHARRVADLPVYVRELATSGTFAALDVAGAFA